MADLFTRLYVWAFIITPNAGWLTDLTNWLKGVVTALFRAIKDFFLDFLELAVKTLVDGILLIVNAIPSPDFLGNVSICGFLNSAGPTVGWILGTFHIAEGVVMVTAALVFRMTRKALTLFQW